MFSFLNRLPIAAKLPLIMVSLAAMNTGINAFLNDRMMTEALLNLAEEKVAVITHEKTTELKNYINLIAEDLMIVSESDYTRAALKDFGQAWGMLSTEGDSPLNSLQTLYIKTPAEGGANPNPAGEKYKLDNAADGSLYSHVHETYHPWFRTLQQQRGYYDVFLFDLDGNVIYSVSKELDFATNALTGQWKDSGIAAVFKAARAANADTPFVFDDFRAYGPSNDMAAAFIARPVFDKSRTQMQGVLVFQMPVERVSSILASDASDRSLTTYLVGANDNLLRNDPYKGAESQILKTRLETTDITRAGQGERGHLPVSKDGRDFLAAFEGLDIANTRWVITTHLDKSAVLKSIGEIARVGMITAAIVLSIIALFTIWYSQMVTRPIKAMVTAMNELTHGNLSVTIPGLKRGDEIGAMAKSVDVFKQNAQRMEAMKAEQEQLKLQVESDKKTAMARMADDFDQRTHDVVNALSEAAGQMNTAALQLNNVSQQTAQASSVVAAAATQADANVQTVAAASEELSASSQEIARQVSSVAHKASAASDEADGTSRAVNELNELAQSIGEVVGAIKDIADQTNLLALNATIEAARAGEAGKGFAVVADEVKKLAQETASKTELIGERVSKIQNAIRVSVGAVQSIIRNIQQIDEAAANVSSAVEEQNAATGEIGRNVAQASTGTQQVSQIIVDVSRNAAETGESAQSVLRTAQELAQISDMLKSAIQGFLQEIRGQK